MFLHTQRHLSDPGLIFVIPVPSPEINALDRQLELSTLLSLRAGSPRVRERHERS